MFFKDYSFLVVFDAYLRSKCTTPDIYTCDGAGLVVIRSLRTAIVDMARFKVTFPLIFGMRTCSHGSQARRRYSIYGFKHLK